MTTIKFILKDESGRKEKYEIALEGAHISYHVAAFKSFLLVLGFAPDLIKEFINED